RRPRTCWPSSRPSGPTAGAKRRRRTDPLPAAGSGRAGQGSSFLRTGLVVPSHLIISGGPEAPAPHRLHTSASSRPRPSGPNSLHGRGLFPRHALTSSLVLEEWEISIRRSCPWGETRAGRRRATMGNWDSSKNPVNIASKWSGVPTYLKQYAAAYEILSDEATVMRVLTKLAESATTLE